MTESTIIQAPPADCCAGCGRESGCDPDCPTKRTPEVEWDCCHCGKRRSSLRAHNCLRHQRIKAGFYWFFIISALWFAMACSNPATTKTPTKPANGWERVRTLMGSALSPAETPGVAMARLNTGDVPPWGLPRTPFLKVGQATLALNQTWPSGEPVRPNSTMHPRGWGTDIDVVPDGEGGWHAWMNWPDPSPANLGTQIAYLHSKDDGLTWTIPKVVRSKRGLPPWANNGVETPSVAWSGFENRWIGAALVKQFKPGTALEQGRHDRIAFFRFGSPGDPWEWDQSIPLLDVNPDASFEQRWWNGPQGQFGGYYDGGLQEPSVHWFGDVLVVWYTAHTYGNGWRPSNGIAAWVAREERWLRWPEPVIPNGGQIDVQMHPRGGMRAYTQAKPGTLASTEKVIECRFSWNGFDWSDPVQCFGPSSDDTAWDSRRTTAACATFLPDGRTRAYYFGDSLRDETRWIGIADEPAR